MQFAVTRLAGVMQVTSLAHADQRGSFRRTWCADSFAAGGLDFVPHQSSLSVNPTLHTLRGLHWQAEPQGEQKLVRCVAGAVWDVAVDLRPGSASYLGWVGVELTADQGNALFLPRGIAHGFVTLTADAVVEYLIDTPYHPASARGARWDDPALAIDWPVRPALIGDKDRGWPDVG